MKIDFVIPWVDGTDLKWINDKNKYLPENQNQISASEERYRSWDNLQYWFRAVEKFAPWVNHIYFVTWGHIPEWLNTDAEKLTVVKHRDYIPEKYLPTFSANPIELNLHRIKNLEEHFVYFNDDFFLIDQVCPEDFFKDGLPCDYAVESPITPNRKDVFNNILINNMVLLNSQFSRKDVLKKWRRKFYSLADLKGLMTNLCMSPLRRDDFFGFAYSHLPANFLKSTFERVWNDNYEILDKVSGNKFRSTDDVNQYIISNYQYAMGKFSPRGWAKVGEAIQLNDIEDNISYACDIISGQKKKMVCINDSEVHSFERTRDRINRALEKILPEKSIFER
ncbi:hypothetical protein C818_02921 [Lachnospiraceae bacterium MD308]|nr:hypothetical protein C818_02921 [Lachnospiraceae bacterium MD308]